MTEKKIALRLKHAVGLELLSSCVPDMLSITIKAKTANDKSEVKFTL